MLGRLVSYCRNSPSLRFKTLAKIGNISNLHCVYREGHLLANLGRADLYIFGMFHHLA